MKIEKVIIEDEPRAFFLVIDGKKEQLHTFRRTFEKNSVVYLPPPYSEQVAPLGLFDDPENENSEVTKVQGVFFHRAAAKLAKQFREGTAKAGTYEMD